MSQSTKPRDFAWTQDQLYALDAVNKWLGSGRAWSSQPVFKLFGYAGTGKTTLARHLAANIDGPVLFAAPTGKAAQQLRSKGCANAATIHQLAYAFIDRDKHGNPIFEKRDRSVIEHAAMVVVDECSMITQEMMADLLSFGCPILALGDPAQLPPPKGVPFFQKEPDAMLVEITRQAADNPLIRESMRVRHEGRYQDAPGFLDTIQLNDATEQMMLTADQILVGTNAMRESVNRQYRKWVGIEAPLPLEGERVVCLRNNHNLGIYNGGVYTLTANAREARKDTLEIAIHNGERNLVLPVDAGSFRGKKPCFETKNEIFDYGYGLTVHKAQGSEWNNIIIIDDWRHANDRKAWLYTALTRARDRCIVLKP